MRRSVLLFGMILLVLSVAGVSATRAGSSTLEVTITNLTQDQSFTPILAASHKEGVRLFTAGDPASSQLETLAEEGDTGPLMGLLLSMPDKVADVTTSGGLLGPGETKTVTVETWGPFDHISIAAMLIPTNDTFFALNGVKAPKYAATFNSPGYDAGTEDNDETCASIPGPPYPECGGLPGGGGAPPGGEGYVYISPGIHGIGDFAVTRDWRNPVARITVERVTDDEDEDEDED